MGNNELERDEYVVREHETGEEFRYGLDHALTVVDPGTSGFYRVMVESVSADGSRKLVRTHDGASIDSADGGVSVVVEIGIEAGIPIQDDRGK